MDRLFRNLNGYRGETINLPAVLKNCIESATRAGMAVQHLPVSHGDNLVVMTRPRPGIEDPPRIYISAGIHGDEPAGVVAVQKLLEDLSWRENASLWICPCLNPAGFALNQRGDRLGTDLNRDYQFLKTEEVRAHVKWLEQQPRFDLCLCLHEDWESGGFYLYELNPDHRPSVAEKIIEDVRAVCPIDEASLIDGRAAAGGIIRPGAEAMLRQDWPEALYLIRFKTRHSYTFEAPSDFPLRRRVNALACAVRAAVRLHLGRFGAGVGER